MSVEESILNSKSLSDCTSTIPNSVPCLLMGYHIT